MTEKFTPGEWRTEDFNEWDIAGFFIVDKEDSPIAKMCERFVMTPRPGSNFSQLVESKEEQEANAYLLTAAPKMYERLKGVRCFLWTCLQYEQYSDPLYKQIEHQVERIDEVLKEARGDK